MSHADGSDHEDTERHGDHGDDDHEGPAHGDEEDVRLRADSDSDRAAEEGATAEHGTDTPAAAAAATPAVVGPLNEYTIFDVTPAQIQARIDALNARNVADAANPLNDDDKLELAQLLYWVEERKFQEMIEHGTHTDDELNAASVIVTDRIKRIRDLNARANPWTYHKDYKAAKSARITDIRARLKNILDQTALLDADKTALLNATEKKLTDQDHTLASMDTFATTIDTMDPGSITDPNAGQQQLQTLMQPLALRKPATAATQSKAPSAKVPTNNKQKAEIPKVNPFVLSTHGVMAQMVEAFFKSFMLWPWQIVFEVGMRMVSEVASKPLGMAMIGLGVAFKAVGWPLSKVFNMRTLDKYANNLLASGSELDGTLPFIARAIAGGLTGLTGAVTGSKALKAASAELLRNDKMTENFLNSAVLTPIRIIPVGGALVWNSLNGLRCGALAIGNLYMSGYNNGIADVHEYFGNQEAAKARFLAAQKYNANTRYYAGTTANIFTHMLTHPFSGMLAPAPISAGGDSMKQAGYSFLEGISPWFDSNNMGCWISEAYKRGTIHSNPSIKTVGYFEQQDKKLNEISKILHGTQLSDARIDAEIKEITHGNYSMEEMDAYIADIKANLDPKTTDANAHILQRFFDKNLVTAQNLNVPRLFLDHMARGFTWWPLALAVEILAPVIIPVAMVAYLVYKSPEALWGVVSAPFKFPGWAWGKIKDLFRGRSEPVDDASSVASGPRESISEIDEVEAPAPELPVLTEAQARAMHVHSAAWDERLRQFPDLSAAERDNFGIPHDYNRGDAAKYRAAQESEVIGTTPRQAPVPLPGLVRQAEPTHTATPSPQRIPSTSSINWPDQDRGDPSRIIVRNPLAIIGRPFTRMYDLATSMGGGLFAKVRATELTVNRIPREPEPVVTPRIE